MIDLPIDEVWLAWIVVLSFITFLAGIALLPAVIVAIPSDYFTRERRPATSVFRRHPVVSLLTKIVKNVVGFVFLMAGLVMLVTPGQGMLAMLVGLSLMDIPGKRAVQLWILRRPAIENLVNTVRRRANRPPLVLPNE